MMFRVVFWVILMMDAVRTSETSVDNHLTRQYIPEDSSEHFIIFFDLKKVRETRVLTLAHDLPANVCEDCLGLRAKPRRYRVLDLFYVNHVRL
jgi:hypothetical protein